MPGLFGFATTREPVEGLLEKMAVALGGSSQGSLPAYKVELHHGADFGLGRCSLETFNPGGQPAWDASRTVALVFEGELYDQPELYHLLPDSLARSQHLDTPALILALYQQLGEGFINHLNGVFALALWDARQSRLLLANDRLGLYPLYYAQTPGSLLFGSGVRALLASPDLPRTVDLTGMAQYLAFDHMLDDHTLLDAVRLLPQACCLTWQAGQMRIQPYWQLRYLEQYPLRSTEDYLEELKTLLRQAMRRQAPAGLTPGLLLSGGLDSRLLLGLLAEVTDPHQMSTFTWGLSNSDDVRFARELARARHTRHHVFPLQTDWLLKQAEEAVRLTDGLGNIVHLHALVAAEQESQLAQVGYKGFLGDAMFGFALNLRMWADYADEQRYQAHRITHHDMTVINFDEQEQKLLLSAQVQHSVGDAVRQSYRDGLDASGSQQMGIQRLYFDMRQRVPRMTLNGVEVLRSRMPVRLLYADYDLVDFSLNLPLGHHYQRSLITRAFIEMYPDLAKIPATPKGLPMIATYRETWLRAWELTRWHLRRHGLGRLAGSDARPYKDYPNWFRTILRPWVEETLLSPRSLERGYFNPDYLRKLVADHMAGANVAVKLGNLLSLELWHRQFMD